MFILGNSGLKMKVTVTDFDTSIKVQDDFDHVIGILDKRDFHDLSDGLSKIPNRSMFWFDDVHADGSNPPTERHIQHIIDLIKEKELDSIHKRVLVHCRAGISRSTATAIALLIMRGHSISSAFETIHIQRPMMWPNDLMIQHFDKLLDLKGKLVAHHKEWKRDTIFGDKLNWNKE